MLGLNVFLQLAPLLPVGKILHLDTVANKTFGGVKDEIARRSGIRSWKFYLHDGWGCEYRDMGFRTFTHYQWGGTPPF